MKYLITGVQGVVGKNLYQQLSINNKLNVYGTGRHQSELNNYFELDLTNRVSVLNLFQKENFDCIIHCAADLSNEQPFKMYNNNITSTLNIVEACLESNVRKIFHTSGITVIGKILERPITEKHYVEPSSTYLYSKYQSERIINFFCKGKIDFINIRIPSPVGQEMPLRSMFPIFLDRIQNDLEINLYGDIRRKMNFLDLRDLANFILKASNINGVSGVFNVSAQKSHSDFEVAEAIISRTGSRSKIINNMIDSNTDFQNWDISTLKAKVNFGYTPQFSLEETIDWVLNTKK